MTYEEMREQELFELDRFCASIVMKWPRRTDENFYNHSQWKWECVDGAVYVPDMDVYKFRYFTPTVCHYASSLVIEKCGLVMRDGVYGYSITTQNRGGRWSVSCWKELGIEVEADTLPLARVLFAKSLFKEDKDK